MHGSVQQKALATQCLQSYTTLLGSVLHLHGGTGLRQVSSSGVQEAHIVRQLNAGLCLRGLNIAPGQAKCKNGGRHNATARRCSLCNFPAVRASPRLGCLTGLSLAVVLLRAASMHSRCRQRHGQQIASILHDKAFLATYFAEPEISACKPAADMKIVHSLAPTSY